MANENGQEIEVSQKKKGIPLIALVAAAAVVIGVGGFFAGKMLSGKGKTDPAKISEPQKEEVKGEEKKVEGGSELGESKKAEGEVAKEGEAKSGDVKPAGNSDSRPGVLQLDEFTVNLNDPFGRRYANLLISLEVENKEIIEKIKKDELLMPKIRDRIFMIISSKTFNDMNSVAGKITLKEEMLMQINEILMAVFNSEPVKSVLFSKYLIQ